MKLNIDIYLQAKKYKLGYEIQCTNPKDATDEFLKREFKEVLTKDHDTLFIPDSFVYKEGITVKVHNLKTVEVTLPIVITLGLSQIW